MATKLDLQLEQSTAILKDIGIVDVGEGVMSVNIDGNMEPVLIAKKRLVLPTKERLKAGGGWDTTIPFAPYSEQMGGSPSIMLNALKTYIQFTVSERLKVIARNLFELGCDKKRQKNVSAAGSAFLKGLPEAGARTLPAAIKVIERIGASPEARLMTLILKNGSDDGKLRSTVVTFPILDEDHITSPEEFFGVAMTRKDKDTQFIRGILEYVLDVNASASSSDGEAPYYHCLLQTFAHFIRHINHLVKLHGAACPDIKGLGFAFDWEESLGEFTEFARINGPAVPPLPWNRGEERDREGNARTTPFIDETERETVDHHRRDDRDDRRDSRDDRDDRRYRDDRDSRRYDRDDRRSRRYGRDDRDDRDDRRYGRDDRDDRRYSRRDEPAVRTLSDRMGGRDRDRGSRRR